MINDTTAFVDVAATTRTTVIAQHNAQVPAPLPSGSVHVAPPVPVMAAGEDASQLTSAQWWRDFGAAALAPFIPDALLALAQGATALGRADVVAALDVLNAATTDASVREFMYGYVAKTWAEAAEGFQLMAEGEAAGGSALYDWSARATHYHDAAAQAVRDDGALAVLNQMIAGGGTVFSTLAGMTQLAGQGESLNLQMTVPGVAVLGADLITAVLGGVGADTILTGAACDAVMGFEGDDAIMSGDGDDAICGGQGDDQIDGGPGVDTVMYPAAEGNYIVSVTPGAVTVFGPEGVDSLANVERIRFADALLGLDTQAASADVESGHLWQVAALFQAAFGRLPGTSDMSHWTAHADQSRDMGELAQAMIDHYAPGLSVPAIVAYLYRGIVHQEASQQLIDAYCAQIGPGRPYATVADLAAWGASLPMNTEPAVTLLGTMQHLDPAMF